MTVRENGSPANTEFDRVRQVFDDLPLLVEGDSKIVRCLGEDQVMIRLKPTLFSYSANRAGQVPGTDELRLRISKRLWGVLEAGGVPTTITYVGDDYYVSKRVQAPPIETIVKAAQVGTPKHIYQGLATFPTRNGGFVLPGQRHLPYVRFDWRNPLPMRDECMPLGLADQFIDTGAAERLALRAFSALATFLASRQIELLDICFFVTVDGDAVFGEVSPDCMRAKFKADDLDKDLWRNGKDAGTVLQKWTEFCRRVEEAESV